MTPQEIDAALFSEEEISRLEQISGRRVIVYAVDRVDESDAYYVSRCLRRFNREPLQLIVACGGGEVSAADKFWRQISALSGGYTVSLLGPTVSSGTLLTLAAHQIVFPPHAYLSPIDPQIRQIGRNPGAGPNVSSEEIRLIPEMVRDWFGVDAIATCTDSLVATAASQMFVPSFISAYRAERFMLSSARAALATHMEKDKAEKISEKLVRGYDNHAQVLLCNEAKSIGLPAKEADSESEILLWEAFTRRVDAGANGGDGNSLASFSGVIQAADFLALRSDIWSIRK